jgi:hypothetical protein
VGGPLAVGKSELLRTLSNFFEGPTIVFFSYIICYLIIGIMLGGLCTRLEKQLEKVSFVSCAGGKQIV